MAEAPTSPPTPDSRAANTARRARAVSPTHNRHPARLWDRLRGAKVAIAAGALLSVGVILRLVSLIWELRLGAPAGPQIKPWLQGLDDTSMAMITTGAVGVVYEYFIRRESEESFSMRIESAVDQVRERLLKDLDPITLLRRGELDGTTSAAVRRAIASMASTQNVEARILEQIRRADWHYSHHAVRLRLMPPLSSGPTSAQAAVRFRQMEVIQRYGMVFREPTQLRLARLVLTSSLATYQRAMRSQELEFAWLCRPLDATPEGHMLASFESLRVDGRDIPVGDSKLSQVDGERSWVLEAPLNQQGARSRFEVELRVLVPINAENDYVFYSLDRCAEQFTIEVDCSSDPSIRNLVPLPMVDCTNGHGNEAKLINKGRTVLLATDQTVMPNSGMTVVWERLRSTPPSESRPDPEDVHGSTRNT